MATAFSTGMRGPEAVAALNGLWDRVTEDAYSTSASSLSVATGTVSLVTQIDKKWVLGQYVSLTRTADVSVSMRGTVTAYNAATGALTVLVNESAGTGTYAGWTIALAGSYAALAAAYVNSINNTQELRQLLANYIASHP